MSTIWPKFSKEHPCPKCGHWDWTCRAGTKMFVCMRVESDRPNKDGGWLHFFDGGKSFIPPRRFVPPSAPRINPQSVVVKSCGEDLAAELGVSMAALRTLGVGWSDQYGAWMFPMRNGSNEVVGWNRRYKNGEKKIVAGTKGGLYIPQIDVQETAFICEGGSDTAALLDLGFFAIGRFNVSSGAEDLKTFFSDNKIFRAVIIADNDSLKNLNGRKARPGIEGAIRLKKALGITSVIWQPPSPCKDVREFVKRGGTRELILSDLRTKVWSKK